MSKRSKARARAYERKQALAAARAHKPAPPSLVVVTGTPSLRAAWPLLSSGRCSAPRRRFGGHTVASARIIRCTAMSRTTLLTIPLRAPAF
jgi:hypothetical protein